MGSPSFGMMPGNNAPMPVFGGRNPTGMNYGSPGGGLNSSFPNYPMFGGSPTGIGGYVTPTANMGIFGSPGGMQTMNSGFGVPYGGNDNGLMGSLDSAYGEGTGHLLDSIFSNGLFNPQVANSFLNAMQPSYNRGVASLETAFGAEGSRFGSAAALGIGDFSSQFSLNEQQTMATMYMQAQQEQLQLLEGILPTMHAEAANSGGIWGDVLGGLEAVGGIVAAPFTGGMSLGLTAAGIGQIIGANSGGSSGGGFSGGGQQITNPYGIPGFGGGSGSYGPYNGGSASKNDALDWQIMSEQQQAGAALGGTDNSSFAPWMVGGGYN